MINNNDLLVTPLFSNLSFVITLMMEGLHLSYADLIVISEKYKTLWPVFCDICLVILVFETTVINSSLWNQLI